MNAASPRSSAPRRPSSPQMEKELGQSIVVDNRPGANGMIGGNAVAHSAPDGYTFLLVVAAHAINPSLYAKMSYDPERNLTGVSLIARIPLLLASSGNLPPSSVKELLAWGAGNPGRLTYASTGIGSGSHLVTELFSQAVKVPMTHVVYKGSSAAMPDVFSGG